MNSSEDEDGSDEDKENKDPRVSYGFEAAVLSELIILSKPKRRLKMVQNEDGVHLTKIERYSDIIENIIYYRFVIRLMAEELQQKLPWKEDPKVKRLKISNHWWVMYWSGMG